MEIVSHFRDFVSQEGLELSVNEAIHKMVVGQDEVLREFSTFDFWADAAVNFEKACDGARKLREGQEIMHRVMAAFYQVREGKRLTREVMEEPEFILLWEDVVGTYHWQTRELFVHRFGSMPEDWPQVCAYDFWYGE